jgi:hypothetical protein
VIAALWWGGYHGGQMRPAFAAFAVLFLAAAGPTGGGAAQSPSGGAAQSPGGGAAQSPGGGAAQNNVPLALQRRVIAHYSHLFLRPQTALWQFDVARPYLLGGTLVCGHVNYEDSEHRYVGASPFYLVLTDSGTGDGDVLPADPTQDPTGTITSTYRAVCKPPR